MSIDIRGLHEYDWERSHGGARRDSYVEFYNELGLVGAIAKTLKLKQGPRAIRAGQRIHNSVIEIMQDKIAPGQEPYIPRARYNGNSLSANVNPGIEPWGSL